MSLWGCPQPPCGDKGADGAVKVGGFSLITSTGSNKVGFGLFLWADLPVSLFKLSRRCVEAAGVELREWTIYILVPMFGQLGINDWSEATQKISIKHSGFLCAWCTTPTCKYHGRLSNPLVAALTEAPAVHCEHVWVLLGSLGSLSCVSFYCSGYPVLPPAAF